MVRQKDIDNERLRDEMNNMAAKVQEKEGAVTHWKIKNEDVNRQIADLEERHSLLIKGDLIRCYPVGKVEPSEMFC